MTESIFNTIKKMLGLSVDYTAFDADILVHINSVFMVLHQLGVGPEDVYSIDGPSQKWEDFSEEINTYSAIKSYMFLSVKLLFDPNQTSFVNDSLSRQKQELEWRLNVQVPIPETEET